MSLTTPPSVQKLQTALHDKAKGSPKFRFYALYDKVYRQDVLVFAYECCKANGGAAGVDGQTFEDIEAYGVGKWLDEVAQELRSRTYQPQPVRPRASQQSLPSGGSTCSKAAASVAMCQAQSGRGGARAVPEGLPLSSAGPCSPQRADE
jgi:hypothetical protein